MGKNKKRKKNKKFEQQMHGKPTMAEQADRYVLYQQSVQEPSCEVEFIDTTFRKLRNRKPLLLREDFCGTFAVCCDWVKDPERHALGVDLDPEPLAWGRAHNLAPLDESAQARVTLRERDVRTVADEKADVLAAQNFSYWIFNTRSELKRYFEITKQNMKEDGLLVLDVMGGGECYQEGSPDKRKCKGFKYLWEMESFDPFTNLATHTISFKFKDGSRIDRAFEYSWRFWTIPELREILEEAGYASSIVYWETEDEDGEGTAEWEAAEKGTCDPSWIAYIVALP